MFLFLVLIVLSFIPFISVICLRLKKSEDFFFQFLLNFVSTFYKNCLHVWLLVGLCIIFSFHSLQWVVLFYVVSLSFKSQTISFTASSTSLPDSLLLLFNLTLNVNHSKKRSVIFAFWWFKQKNFSSIKRLPNLQLLFHSVFCWTQNDTFFVIIFCRTFLDF